MHLETVLHSFSFSNSFTDIHATLLTKSWVVETWRFMQSHAITIELPLPQFRLHRLNDQFLMSTLINSSIPRTQWKQFNKCHLYLNVMSLADISSGDGVYIHKDLLTGTFDYGTSHTSVKWPPRQHPLSTTSWKVWYDYLLQLFCTGTTGRLVTRLGAWCPYDINNTWEWYIQADSSTLIQQNKGLLRLFKQQGRSRIAPKFSIIPIPVTHFDTTHQYLRTTITHTAISIHSQGSSILDATVAWLEPILTRFFTTVLEALSITIST